MRGQGVKLDGEPHVLEVLNQAAGGGGLVSPVEVVGAKILIERAVLEHVIDGAQEGGGDLTDGLFGAPTGLDSVELGPYPGFTLYRHYEPPDIRSTLKTGKHGGQWSLCGAHNHPPKRASVGFGFRRFYRLLRPVPNRIQL